MNRRSLLAARPRGKRSSSYRLAKGNKGIWMTKSSAYTTIVHSVPLPIGSASDLHWLSIVTAFVSIGTLLAVFRQIKIANTQLSVANDSLALAKEQIDLGNQELQAVKEDLDLNRQQVSELTRRPNLQIVFSKPNAADYIFYYQLRLPTQRRVPNHYRERRVPRIKLLPNQPVCSS